MALNPPATVTYDSRTEALEALEILRFVRLPVRGPIERWACDTVADDGTPIIIFASSAGRNAQGAVVAYEFVEVAKKA